MKKNLFILASMVLFFLAACKKDSTTTVASVITPGTGITEINIGQTAQEIINKLGAGSDSNFSIGGFYTHSKTYLDKGISVQFEQSTSSKITSDQKILYITVSSPYTGATSKGIKIGSKKSEVTAAYGNPISSSAFFGDVYTGMTITYDDKDIIESIEITK